MLGTLIFWGFVFFGLAVAWALHEWLLRRPPRDAAMRRIWEALDARAACSSLYVHVRTKVDDVAVDIDVIDGKIHLDEMTLVYQRTRLSWDGARIVKKAKRIAAGIAATERARSPHGAGAAAKLLSLYPKHTAESVSKEIVDGGGRRRVTLRGPGVKRL